MADTDKRTIVMNVPARVLIHLDPDSMIATKLVIAPHEADAGYFGPTTDIEYVFTGDDSGFYGDSRTEPSDEDVALVKEIWNADVAWDVLNQLPANVEWVV